MTTTPEELVRNDGALVNVLTGLGVPSKDKTLATKVGVTTLLTESELEALYANGIPRRYVDAIADAMLRHNVTIKLGEDADEVSRDTIRDFERFLRDTKFHQALTEVVKLQRLYGGAGLVLLIDDGQTPDQPVNLETLRSVNGYVPLSRHELIPNDVTITDYSKPDHYRITTSQRLTPDQTEPTIDLIVHNTRVARFDGLYLPWKMRSRNTGWGMSCIQLLWDAFKRYMSAMQGLENMLSDSDLFVHKIPGLFNRLAAGGESDITKRLEANSLSRSMYGGMVVDREEEIQFLTRALANIAQATDPFAREMQAATGWPASILMGDSPGGLGKEGRFEERVWADLVEQWQAIYCRDPIQEVFTYILASFDGPTGGEIPQDWAVHFPSVFTETDTEKTALRLQQAQIDSTYASLQVLNPLEIRMARFGGTEFSLDTPLNETVTERMAAMQDAQHESQMVAAAMEPQQAVNNAAASEAQTQAQIAQAEQATQQPPENGQPPAAQQKPTPKAKPGATAKKDTADTPEIVDFGRFPLVVLKRFDGFFYGTPLPDSIRADATLAPGICVGPSNRAASPIYRIQFTTDSITTEGPYVIGFRLKSTAQKASTLLFPSHNGISLRELDPEETALFANHWE